MAFITEYKDIQRKIGLIGKSPKLEKVLHLMQTVAPSMISVLIHGESGTGKEVVARGIHLLSRRKDHNMLSVNCGAIPETLLESELFGHEKGAFTGAQGQKKGYFEEADGSTLFLDEIGDMALKTQVKLLRVLETGEFFRVGGTEVVHTDVRVIAASNKKLEQLVHNGLFREDLFFRLKSVVLELPPLRERREDLPVLIDHFVKNFQSRNQIVFGGFLPDTEKRMFDYHWPGNIRELKNIIETLIVLASGNPIPLALLESQLIEKQIQDPLDEDRYLPQPTNIPVDQVEREMIYRTLLQVGMDIREMKQMLNAVIRKQASLPAFTDSEMESYELDLTETEAVNGEIVPSDSDMSLENMEKELIRKMLHKYSGNRKKTAQTLNISERTLYRKIKEYDIQ
jgi:DNA-binding NtrC family response regulator